VLRRVLPLLALALPSCSRPPAPVPEPSRPAEVIHNLRPLGDDLWSGATPEGDDGFRALRDLGIQTIVSVDGTRPDVEGARQFGMRYVHLPVGYGGLPREQVVQLARAATDLPGPIFVHCHHGQHRGPAAAALMRRCRPGGWSADEAVAFLKTAGTDPRYEGLFASVREFAPPSADELRTAVAFPEVAEVGDLTARMVEVDDAWAALKRAKATDWQTRAESPAHLALRLRELYRESARLPDAPSRPESFRRMLADAELGAAELEAALRSGDTAAAGKAFDRSAALCSSCHREHRDRPPAR
jgi:protein tyrosine phosphatase (PTP) superfamily phosphohydrolase (DUF442 family)